MALFTVRATLVGGEKGAASWGFADPVLADEKFTEVCGPLCEEAWLLHWVDDRFIRGRKEVYLQRRWTFQTGVDSSRKLLGRVNVLEKKDLKREANAPETGAPKTDETERINDLSTSLIRGDSVHNFRELDWDFDGPADDSRIHVLVDSDRITHDGEFGHFELRFAKVSSRHNVSFPDSTSCFDNLAFRCQWNVNDRWTPGEETYGWSTDYRNVGNVGLNRAECMALTLKRIAEIEETLPFKPSSFGEYAVIMAQRLGLNPDSIGCLKSQDDSPGLHEIEAKKHARLNSSELRIAIDDAVAGRMQSFRPRRKHRFFIVSDEPAIVETVPQMFLDKGCDAVGSLSFRGGSWAYERVLKEAVDFQPKNMCIF
jgi:hypothetical protein